MDALTAAMMKELIPSVTSVMSASQVPFALPKNYEKILGSYAGVVVIGEGDRIVEGYLEGTIAYFASPVLYWWDSAQDYTLNGVHYTAMRYRTYNRTSLEATCFSVSGVGEQAILYFTTVGVPTVTYPDERIYLLPKTH